MSLRSSLFSLGVLLALAIAFVSALPTQAKFALHTQGALHPWLHFLGFLILTCLLLSAVRSKVLRVGLVTALLLFGYATEVHESRKDGWPIEGRDVRTDVAGVLLGSVLGVLRSPNRLR